MNTPVKPLKLPAAEVEGNNAFHGIPVAVMEKLTPQARALVVHLVRMGSITQREALLDLSVQSLTKRISELRDYFVIVSDFRVHKATQQRYVRYFFKGLVPAKQVVDAVRRPMPDEVDALV